MDRIVVRKIMGEDNKYVVVEGNRRIAAIKSILNDHKAGELTLDESLLAQLQEIEVLELMTDPERFPLYQASLQGVRHISGVKEWGPYQKANAIMALLKIGKNLREAGETLGALSVTMVNRYRRAYLALNEMGKDDEYGEYATSDMFSYFEEVMKRPYLRDTWLKWDDEKEKFLNENNLKLLYSWITPNEDLSGNKKIPMAINIRDLPDILQDSEIYQYFTRPEITIKDVSTRRSIPIEPIDWRAELQRAYSILSSGITISTFTANDVELLNKILDVAKRRIEQIQSLMEYKP
jgi:hypothetical protein